MPTFTLSDFKFLLDFILFTFYCDFLGFFFLTYHLLNLPLWFSNNGSFFHFTKKILRFTKRKMICSICYVIAARTNFSSFHLKKTDLIAMAGSFISCTLRSCKPDRLFSSNQSPKRNYWLIGPLYFIWTQDSEKVGTTWSGLNQSSDNFPTPTLVSELSQCC